MFPATHIRSRRIRRFLVPMALGCLFKAGLAMGMPMAGEGAAPGGTITFSGAIVTPTCAVPAAGSAGASAQGQCQVGQDRSTYRVSTAQISPQTDVLLLQYANERYRNTKLVTYTYD